MRRFWKRALVLAAAVTTVGWLSVARSEVDARTVRIGDVTWYTDLAYATQVARREGKPLWVHFGENPG
ncbi:MAG: hypothetical protein FJX76_02850 [Armatimonadetes bacterium]|nr:hypothetical protein [Armatimonadota bacterium]